MPPKRDNDATGRGHSQNASSNTNSSGKTIGFNRTGTTPLPAKVATLSAFVPPPTDAEEQRQQLFIVNSKLCRLVRKCPWMYDRSHPSYAKKQILDKSWKKIAKDCNDSVASCKERWRNIRAAFARSINIYRTTMGPNRVKPYYLHSELDFLVKPMRRGRRTTAAQQQQQQKPRQDQQKVEEEDAASPAGKYPKDPDASEQDQSLPYTAKVECDGLDDDGSLEPQMMLTTSDVEADVTFPEEEPGSAMDGRMPPHLQGSNTTAEQSMGVASTTAPQGFLFSDGAEPPNRFCLPHAFAPIEAPTTSPTVTTTTRTTVAKTPGAAASDADWKFFEALLPDMRSMNVRQKVIFKRKIYQCLEEVLDTATDFPTTSAFHISAPQSVAHSVLGGVASLNDLELQRVQSVIENEVRQRLHIPSDYAMPTSPSMPRPQVGQQHCTATVSSSMGNPSSPFGTPTATTTWVPIAVKHECDDVEID